MLRVSLCRGILPYKASVKKEGRAVTAEEIRKEDKMRSSYYSYYTGRNWYDMENYDLAINLATIEAEEAAQLILDYMEKENKLQID